MERSELWLVEIIVVYIIYDHERTRSLYTTQKLPPYKLLVVYSNLGFEVLRFVLRNTSVIQKSADRLILPARS